VKGTLRWLGRCVAYALAAYAYDRHGRYVGRRRLLLLFSAAVPVVLTADPRLASVGAGLMPAFYLDGWRGVLPALWRARPWGVSA